MKDPFFKKFILPLPKKFRGRSVGSLHEALSAISTVQPGGNVPNMVRNISHLMRSGLLPEETEMELYSTDEPIFQSWFDALEQPIRDRIRLTLIDVPPRKAFQVQYNSDKPGGIGTLGLVTPMHSTTNKLQAHFANLADSNHVLVSESLGGLVNETTRAKYREFQNPSSAFREQCPVESYNLMLNRGRIPFISMNMGEMDKYLRSIETRRSLGGAASSSSDTEKKPESSFSQPFDDARELNDATVKLVTEGFNRYFSCITPYPEEQIYFPVSVSCDAFGGYHVACTPDGKRYAIFTSTPQGNGAENMLKMVGENDDIKLSTKRTMGAGDSVASILSMVHLWDIQKVMGNLRTKQHPLSPKFVEMASTIFVSLMSRFAGEALYHSDRCDWMSIPPTVFPEIVKKTAEKSLNMAAESWNKIDNKPEIMRDPEWDIDVAMWQI
ncbi:MAG TPA: hypothetical protein VJK52_01545, partial [Candidatus Nanoarchaeia archaeon]|nr:hypothetical protein [Candidatus Nanoarchaeia archaeon]